MGLRFESNFNYLSGVAPFPPDDANVLQRWFRVHEWRVDEGYTGNLLAVLLNAEYAVPPPGTRDYGWMRVRALLDLNTRVWATKFEVKINGVAMIRHWHTPRMVVMPMGSGIPFVAGQGLMTQALGGTTYSNRWWSCYVIDSEVV